MRPTTSSLGNEGNNSPDRQGAGFDTLIGGAGRRYLRLRIRRYRRGARPARPDHGLHGRNRQARSVDDRCEQPVGRSAGLPLPGNERVRRPGRGAALQLRCRPQRDGPRGRHQWRSHCGLCDRAHRQQDAHRYRLRGGQSGRGCHWPVRRIRPRLQPDQPDGRGDPRGIRRRTDAGRMERRHARVAWSVRDLSGRQLLHQSRDRRECHRAAPG